MTCRKGLKKGRLEYREEHFRRQLLVDSNKIFQVEFQFIILFEYILEEESDFFLAVDTVLELISKNGSYGNTCPYYPPPSIVNLPS